MKIVSDDIVSTSNWSNFWQAFASRGFVSDSWAFLFYYLWQLKKSLFNVKIMATLLTVEITTPKQADLIQDTS